MQNKSDAQLLGEYAAQRSEPAFAEIVARHTDLVYSAALRQTGSPELAREIAQSVFTDLARKSRALAGDLRPDTSLAGWLFRGTRFAGLKLLRDDRRRQTRERQFMEHFNPAAETVPDWERVAPVLDEAMAELGDADHEAVLLRYFKNQDFHAVGRALGVSDVAAQKRVSRAVERLRESFAKRGVTVGAQGLVVVISANAVQAAPAGLAGTLSTAAVLTGTTLATAATATATKAIAMTTLQKALIAATLAAAVGTGIYEARQASTLRSQVQTLKQQQSPLAGQVQQLTKDREDAASQLAALRDENERLNRNTAELLRLRGEMAQMKATTARNENDATESAMRSWLSRVDQLKQRLEQTPNAKIPEFEFLTEQDWLGAAKNKLETDADFRTALSQLRYSAESRLAHRLGAAVKQYSESHGGKFTTDISQLKPYLRPPVDDAVLQRYEILPGDSLPSVPLPAIGEWVITQKSAVDPEYDSRIAVGPYGSGSASFEESEVVKALTPAINAYLAANSGKLPEDPAKLVSYVRTPEEQAALQKAIKEFNGMSVEERTAALKKLLRSIK